jgi:hypothetical protein
MILIVVAVSADADRRLHGRQWAPSFLHRSGHDIGTLVVSGKCGCVRILVLGVTRGDASYRS